MSCTSQQFNIENEDYFAIKVWALLNNNTSHVSKESLGKYLRSYLAISAKQIDSSTFDGVDKFTSSTFDIKQTYTLHSNFLIPKEDTESDMFRTEPSHHINLKSNEILTNETPRLMHKQK